MKALLLSHPSKISDVTISDVPVPELGEHDVLVKISYAGVNYADILSVQGLYNWMGKMPYILGLEASGVVEKIGRKVTLFKVRDRVIVPTKNGAYAEYIAKSEDRLLPAPDFLDDKQGASLIAAWFTAWVALMEMARIQSGEVVLIQSAAGGVGIAACEIAKALGATVYGTTSSDSKKKFLSELGVLPLGYDNFDQVLKKTGQLPDMILESVGGDVHERSKKVLAPMGKLVTIGASAIKIRNKLNPLAWYNAWKDFPRISRGDLESQGYMTLHIGHLFESSPERLLPCWNRMIAFMKKHKLKPEVNEQQVYPMSRIVEAFELIDQRKNVGKVIVVPGE